MTAAPPARAALLLAAALWVLALPARAPQPAPCERPAERAARDGHSRAVSCAGGPAVRGPARRLLDLPLDVNRADERSLETLPGIGPARARAIAAERARRPFGTPEELTRVRGIGPRTLARLRPWLAAGPLWRERREPIGSREQGGGEERP